MVPGRVQRNVPQLRYNLDELAMAEGVAAFELGEIDDLKIRDVPCPSPILRWKHTPSLIRRVAKGRGVRPSGCHALLGIARECSLVGFREPKLPPLADRLSISPHRRPFDASWRRMVKVASAWTETAWLDPIALRA